MAVNEIDDYQSNWMDKEKSRAVSDALIAALEKAEKTEDVQFVLDNKEYLPRSPSGPSAATAGPMISASAASTTSWRRTAT